MQVLFPDVPTGSWKEQADSMRKERPLKAFDPITLEFIHSLSKRILTDRKFRNHAEIVAMAHWLRKANLLQLELEYHTKRKDRVWQPRGIVLHFAPSNVDTIFIYSWFLSLLVGNKNIIRLSQRRDEQMNILIDLLKEVVKEEKFHPIAKRTLIVSYQHEDLLTEQVSSFCDVRVIWGGDQSIRSIRKIPLPPRATEMVFANRFSLTAINIDGLADLNADEWEKLASNFYNDAYWFNQMACSSPRLVLWVGEESSSSTTLKDLFWSRLGEVVKKKGIRWEAAVGINRITEGYSYAAQGMVDHLSTALTDHPYRANISNYSNQIKNVECGGGFFFEMHLDKIEKIPEFIEKRDQTLTVFGFEKQKINQLAWELTDKGIDRIVPVGQALNFSEVWDGYDFFVYFTREISIK
ncbi:acyl-CoA reductase [Saccharibacillus deserti]|uniref:acyl-CoA reductase n=1 Tax=Saccharibacillus deserti TaxID=1634444 RepID=UPI0015535B35|nr:acyl-CoA reductase [Saccharibacillus deserti]